MIRKLLPCIGKYKIYAFLSPLFVSIETILEVFIPFYMAKIIDVGLAGGDISYIIKMGALMVLFALFSLLAGAAAARMAAVAAAGFAKGVRKKVFEAMQRFSFANIDKFSTASLVTRVTTDITSVQHAFMMIVRNFVRSPVMLISATIMAFRINRNLASIFLIALPFLAAILITVSLSAFPMFRKMLTKYDKMNSDVQENLSAIRVVKSFVRGDYESERFAAAADRVRQAQMRAENIIVWNMPMMQLTMYMTIAAILWLGGKYIIGGSMGTGDLMGTISYVSQILMSLMMISMVFVTIIMSRASIARIVAVLDEVPDIRTDGTLTDVQDGSIEFENVSFSYYKTEENLVLENTNLSIKSGETVGIIGGTGSSKTTLVQLIPRLYDVLSGTVRVGGEDVRDYDIKSLRAAVSMVLQKNVLFSGTIRENLRWGDTEATDAEIEEAAKSASAHDFIESFPDGYDTVLGQGGVNLSGGQKQRLCIARALLKKPKILILDDSTSAVDTATDKKIRAALRKYHASLTTIIIAQRISSVQDADTIIVLDDGKINGIGTHASLLETNEIYREVYESQQEGKEDAE